MKAIIFYTMVLLSSTVLADVNQKFIGKDGDGKQCILEYNNSVDDDYPEITASVKNKRKKTSIKIGKWYFDEQLIRHRSNDLEFVDFQKDGMSELCDYWDFCLFQKPLKAIAISYGESETPESYVYTTIKDWKEDAPLKIVIECVDLVQSESID